MPFIRVIIKFKKWIAEEQIQQMTDQALGHPVAIKNISLCISQLERAKESTGTGVLEDKISKMW